MKTIYNCIIIDDNPIDIKFLESCLSKLPHLKLIATFSNPIDAIPAIHNETIDLLFLDVEMPEISGINLLNSLKKIPQVILISNHAHYSMDAFEVGVTDFVQKPVSFERLLKSVSRAISVINLQDKTVKELVVPKDDFIFLKSGRELLKFNLSEILYAEAMAAFTKIFTATKTTVISESISDLHTKLPPDSFLRVHKSYLVPLDKIIGISTKNVILKNYKIPMGHSYRESIENILAGTMDINN